MSCNNSDVLPILYSFRRCPYAIRARLALHAAGLNIEMREVALRNKPESMLSASPKGSVPVLLLPDGRVIDESWDIMQWALRQHDPDGWLGTNDGYIKAAFPLVIENDTAFKDRLDRYKYPDRYPEHTQTHYRIQAEIFLQELESRLHTTPFLLGDTLSIADAAIFPFIRQFAGVNEDWFGKSSYVSMQRWLNYILSSDRFSAVMKKYPPWQPGDTPVILTDKASSGNRH